VNSSRLESVTANSLLDVVAVLSSRLSPAFIGGALLTTTGSSATSHHLRRILELPLGSCVTRFSRFASGRADAAEIMPCFPSYCAGSLSEDYVSNHLLQLFLYRASRLVARSLLQPAESSSLSLRSPQLPIASFRPERWPLTPLRVGFSSPETGRGR